MPSVSRRSRKNQDWDAPTPTTPMLSAARKKRQITRGFDELGDVVYFLRRGDQVKIGHSKQLRARLRQHGQAMTDILFLVPGGREVEQAMHSRFASDSVGHEVFTLSPALRAFLDEGRASMGLPAVA